MANVQQLTLEASKVVSHLIDFYKRLEEKEEAEEEEGNLNLTGHNKVSCVWYPPFFVMHVCGKESGRVCGCLLAVSHPPTTSQGVRIAVVVEVVAGASSAWWQKI